MVDDPSSIEDYKELMDYLNNRGEYRRLTESPDPNLQLLGLKVVTNILRKYLHDTEEQRNHKDHKDF
jgi:hypothetical protein